MVHDPGDIPLHTVLRHSDVWLDANSGERLNMPETLDENPPTFVPTPRADAPTDDPITPSPTCLVMSIFLILTLAAQFGWSISRFNVVKAHMLATPFHNCFISYPLW